MPLSSRERAILDFERTWWSLPGPKEQEIRRQFELSAARYYHLLAELLESEEALEYDPLVVRRLGRSAGNQTMKGAALIFAAVVIGFVLLHTAPRVQTQTTVGTTPIPTTKA